VTIQGDRGEAQDVTGEGVKRDRKLITADGPASARAFGHALVEAMR